MWTNLGQDLGEKHEHNMEMFLWIHVNAENMYILN